jgi:hypothetical protein
MVRALRAAGATVLCTQITDRCLEKPEELPGLAVLAPDPALPTLSGRGAACAGTIMLRIPDAGPVEVVRLTDHQVAVDQLPRTGKRPLCRP